MLQNITGGETALQNAANSYNTLMGDVNDSTGTNYRYGVIPTYGYFYNLWTELAPTPSAGTTRSIRLSLNGADTLLQVPYVPGQVSGQDLVHRVRVVPGDLVQYHYTLTGANTAPAVKCTMIWEGDHPGESLILGNSNSSDMVAVPTGGKQYMRIMGNIGWTNTAPTNSAYTLVPTAGIIKDLYCWIATAPGAGAFWDLSLYRNEATSALTCRISDPATTANDVVHSVRVAPGDRISFESIPSVATAPVASRCAWGMTFVPDREGESIMFMGVPNNALDNAAVEYANPDSGFERWGDVTEVISKRLIIESCYMYNLYGYLQFKTGAGKDFTFNVRKNGVDSTLSMKMENVNTANNTTNKEHWNKGDYVSYQCTPTGTPSVGQHQWGWVQYVPPRRQLNIGLNTGRKGKIPHPDMGLGLQRHPRSKIY